jgi:cobalt-zinc-cadmium efflux system membrane fusion protein
MNTTRNNDKGRVVAIALALGMILASVALGQKDEHGHDDHDHAPAPATRKADDHGHAEGEAHGGEKGKHDEHGEEVKLPPQAIKTFDIRTEPARKQVLTDMVIAPARVSFNTEQMAHVGSAVSGRVAEIKVRLGDSVKKGDVLLVVDSPELGEAQSDYLVKRTAIATAEFSVEAAKSAFDRAKQLYEDSKGITLTELQRRETELKVAQGTVLSAQAAATAAENKLHLLGMTQEAVTALEKTKEIDPKYMVRAALGGQVVEREATLGELVGPDREALLVLANMETLWVLADVPEAKLEDVAVGSRARIQLAGRARKTLEGTVSYISPLLDPSTRTAKVRIEVKNGDAPLRPGMFAQVELSAATTDEKQAVLAVPDAAIQTVEGSPAVFVPVDGEAGTFAKRPVKIGPAVGGMIPILAGLKEGEKIVVNGTFILKAEMGKGSAGHEH